jgi:hypothetical protein
MSYLQVVGEQHQLVERHMAAFTARLAELQERHGLQLGSLEVSCCRACRRYEEKSLAGNVSDACRLCVPAAAGCVLQHHLPVHHQAHNKGACLAHSTSSSHQFQLALLKCAACVSCRMLLEWRCG